MLINVMTYQLTTINHQVLTPIGTTNINRESSIHAV